jgi:hypothetical protein
MSVLVGVLGMVLQGRMGYIPPPGNDLTTALITEQDEYATSRLRSARPAVMQPLFSRYTAVVQPS